MDNKTKRNKWIAGFLIYFALMLTINKFVQFSVSEGVFFFVTLIIYVALYLIKTYRKIAVRIFVVLFLTILLVYGLDFGLTYYQNLRTQDLIVEGSSQELDHSASEAIGNTRHSIRIIHGLRDYFDYEKAVDYAKWLANERVGEQLLSGETIDIKPTYEAYTLAIVSGVLVVILGVIFEVKWLAFLLVLPLFLYVGLWYGYIDMPWTTTGLYFAGIVAFFIMAHQEKLLRQHPKYNTTYYRPERILVVSLMMSAMVLLLSGVLAFAFPIKQVNAVVDFLTPNLWGARSGYENEQLKMYSLSETAFQGNSEILGGPVGPINSEDPIFWVSFDQKIDKAVYLRTNAKDHYDGLRWNNFGVIYKNNFKYYLSNENNIELLKSENYDLISGTIKVNRKQAKTVTLFTPLGLIQTDLGGDRVYVSAENEAFYKAGAFVKYLDTYAFKATQRDFNFPAELDYLQVSDRVEQRTIDLAKSLGALGETDYEKMQIMTDFLSQNYAYTLTPPSNRTREDFVTDFLFNKKRGYCTYFASALSVMARINGIPSRYVEGFRVDPNEVVLGALSPVTEKDAHAWTEVYLQDYGWVVFEPTPIYSEVTRLEDTPTLEDILAEEAENDSEITPDDQQSAGLDPVDLEELLMEADGGRGDFSDVNLPNEQVLDNKQNTKIVIWSVVAAVVLLLIFLFSRLPITYLNRKQTHHYAIRVIYYLAYLTSEARNYNLTEPEAVFKRKGFSEHEIQIWLRVLYDQKDRITDEMIAKAIDSAYVHLKHAVEDFVIRKGRFAYFKFRLFEIHKRIP